MVITAHARSYEDKVYSHNLGIDRNGKILQYRKKKFCNLIF